MEIHNVQIRLKLVADLLMSLEVERGRPKIIQQDGIRMLFECIEELEPVKVFLRDTVGRA